MEIRLSPTASFDGQKERKRPFLLTCLLSSETANGKENREKNGFRGSGKQAFYRQKVCFLSSERRFWHMKKYVLGKIIVCFQGIKWHISFVKCHFSFVKWTFPVARPGKGLGWTSVLFVKISLSACAVASKHRRPSSVGVGLALRPKETILRRLGNQSVIL